jgi:hypothetical protein
MEIVQNKTQTSTPKKTLLELSQEANENYATLKQKPDIDAKVGYYKGMLETTAKLVNAIDKKIELLETSNNGEQNNYEIAKFEIEKLDAQTKLVSQKQFFEMWLKRSHEYSIKFEVITQECNRDFDTILAEAKALATEGSYLEKYIQHYFDNIEKAIEGKTDLEKQTVKNEFFLFMKLERDKANASKKFK